MELVATTGKSLEDLAAWWAQHSELPVKKKAALLNTSEKVVHRLTMEPEFRRKVSEFVALRMLDVETETMMYERFRGVLQNNEATAFELEAASRFLTRQAGLYRGDKREVDHSGQIRVEFVLDRPEEYGYSPANRLAGVEGVEDAEFQEIRDGSAGAE